MEKTKKLTFTVPLGQGTQWENNELRYMLRSLEKYCRFDFDVILYTTNKIDWFNGKQKIVKREYPAKLREYFGGNLHYENYYDVINKLKRIISDKDIPEDFMFIYDDMILLGDYYIVDARKITAGNHYEAKKQFFDNPKNKWLRTIHAAIQICQANGYGLYIYETHLPRYFKKSMVERMFSKHNPEDNMIPYAISTLYYNMILAEPAYNYYKQNNIKAGFYGQLGGNDCFKSFTEQEINESVSNKLWANYSNKGLTPALKKWIEENYQEPSRFEK